MSRRLAALLFIIAIAGQVYAGVCGCVRMGQSRSRHSCCKRQKKTGDSISRKTCCPTECLLQRSERPVQDRTQAAAKIKFEVVKEPVAIPRTQFERVVAIEPARISPFTNHRLKYYRPPELYLRHGALLI